jgi:DNA-binding response OmpR family regulator
MVHVTVVEDFEELLEITVFNLRQNGYEVNGVMDAQALDACLENSEIDVLVLDVGLPGEDGFSVARRVRQSHPYVGIIMFTARDDLEDRIAAFNDGADIYLTKPVDIRELCAAIHSVSRRSVERSSYGWTLFPQLYQLKSSCGRQIALTYSESMILSALARSNQHLASRKVLIESIGANYLCYDERRLEALVSRLRRKIAATIGAEAPLRSVNGRGYVFTRRLLQS